MESDDIKFLNIAIKLAAENVRSQNGGPFGALVVKDGLIISKGVNCVTENNDPTAHAEVNAIRNACAILNDYQLAGCTIYSSCEPCPMCLGAIYWSRPTRLVFAASKLDAANVGFDDSFIYSEIQLPLENRKIETKQIQILNKTFPFKLWASMVNRKEY